MVIVSRFAIRRYETIGFLTHDMPPPPLTLKWEVARSQGQLARDPGCTTGVADFTAQFHAQRYVLFVRRLPHRNDDRQEEKDRRYDGG